LIFTTGGLRERLPVNRNLNSGLSMVPCNFWSLTATTNIQEKDDKDWKSHIVRALIWIFTACICPLNVHASYSSQYKSTCNRAAWIYC